MENDDLINGKARRLKETVWRTLVMVRDPKHRSSVETARGGSVMYWACLVASRLLGHPDEKVRLTLKCTDPYFLLRLWQVNQRRTVKELGSFGDMFCDGRLKSPDLSLIQLVFWQKAQRHLLFKILISMLHFKGNNLIYLFLKCQEHHCQSN